MAGQKVTKTAIIGAGTMAEYHVRGYLDAGAEIVGIVDRNPEKARAQARKWGLEAVPVFADLSELQAHVPGVQAVSVITPNKFHHGIVLEALRAGLHVFCEKPPALNAAETEEMAATAEEHGRVLMFDLNNRARLDSQFIKKEIRDGRIGTINSAQAVWQRRNGIPGYGGWFTNKAMAGGGPLIDLLHMIDLALWFMDYPEPEFVLAQTFNDFMTNPDFHGNWGGLVDAKGTVDVESACHAFVRFRTGQVLYIHNSWAELVKQEDVYVALQAQKEGVRIRSVNEVNSCEIYSQANDVATDQCVRFRNDEDMGRTRAPANFIRTINREDAPLTTAAEAVTLMLVIDATYLSAASGRPVRIQDGRCESL